MKNASMRPRLLCAVAALAMSAQAAVAREHTILIMPDAYFPEITYVDPGDTVIFLNTTANTQNIVSDDEEWSLGPIAPSGSMTIVIEPEQETKYYNADIENEETGNLSVFGLLSFEPAPI